MQLKTQPQSLKDLSESPKNGPNPPLTGLKIN
jgi:hypothetical protein